MKTLREAILKEALFSRKNLKSNPFVLTKDDLNGDIKDFPMGVVVRMMEEQELQGNKPDVRVFQDDILSGFDWDKTEAGFDFWSKVLLSRKFELFFKGYPEYENYNIYK